MSYQSAERTSLSEKKGIFAWGFVDNVDNFDMSPYYSPYLRNIRLDGQSAVGRPWHTLFTELEAWSYPKGIGTFYATTGDTLVVRHNIDATHKLYKIEEDATLTSIDTTTLISSDNRMNFANSGDVIYCMNGSDDFGKLTGTTYSTPSTGITNFAPAFSVIFNSSHWASGRSTNPNIVYKSVWDTFDTFSGTWSDEFTFPEEVTGLCANNEALFYFTQNTISVTGSGDISETWWSLVYNTRPLETKDGSAQHNTIVSAGSNVYYLSTSNSINMIARGANVNGFEIVWLSDRKYAGISKILSTLDTDQSMAFGYFLPQEMIIKWFVRTKWSTINDLSIIYDIEKDAFLVDNAKYFYGGVFFNGKNYTISNVEPKVFQDEIWYDDDDSAIQCEYRTKKYYVSDPTINKLLRESRTLLDVNELAEVTQCIYLDDRSEDVKTIYGTNVISSEWWIWISEIWEDEIWSDGEVEDEIDSDYAETYILRDKGNLWQTKQRRQAQRRYKRAKIWSKVRLKNITAKIEVKSELSTNLTP